MLREEIHEHRAELDTMIQTSELENRDLSLPESARADELIKTITQKKDALEIAEKVQAEKLSRMEPAMIAKLNQQRAENGLGPIGGGASSAKMRTDSVGNKYALLGKNDKATSVYRPPCENAAGHYIIAKIFGATRSTPAEIRMAMSTGDNSLGGFAVPNPLAGSIIDLARNASVLVRAGMQTAVLESGSLMIPVLETDATSTTKAENAAFNSSQLVLGGRQVDLKTAGCVITMSRELAEDSADLLAAQVEQILANSLAATVDGWGLAGVAPNPLGLLSRLTLSGSSQIQSTGSVGAIDWLDFIAAATEVRDNNYEPTAAIVSPTIYSDLFSIQTGDGTNAARGWLGRPEVLQNVQFLQTKNCADASAIVGDFSQFLMAMKAGPVVEVSTTAGNAFEKHQVLVKVFQRIDFVPLRTDAFYGLTGITT
jgi:HK97 family phage major capsid protein